MNSYNFEVAHGYKIFRGYISANSKEEAIKAWNLWNLMKRKN